MKKNHRGRVKPPTPAVPRKEGELYSFVLPLIILAAVFVLYWGSLRNPLVFDDRFFREELLQYYGHSWFRFDLRWFAYVTFGWSYDLVGLNWFWYRFGNAVLHGVTAIALYSFLSRLFSPNLVLRASPQPLNYHWSALFAALLFALHPVAVYGVAYLVQRSIIMATLFTVLSLRFHLEGLTRRKTRWFAGAALFYFLAVFSKEHSVMVPGVALALTLLVRGFNLKWLRDLWIPFAVYAAIGLLLVLKTKGIMGAPYESLAGQMVAQLSEARHELDTRATYPLSVINQGYLFFKYLLLWLVPYTGWMSVDLREAFPVGLLSWPQTAGFVGFLAYPCIGVWLLRREDKAGLLGFGMLFPWILFLTEVSTVRIQEPFVLYRSYLWMAGLLAAVPVFLGLFSRRGGMALMAVLCLALVPLSVNRIDTFSSQEKLWDDVVRKNTDRNALYVERGYNNRGVAHLQAGQYLEALRDLNTSLEINRKDADAYVNRGIVLARTSGYETALKDLNKALELDPRHAEAYAERCYVYMQISRLDQALADCRKATEIDPGHADAYGNQGIIYARLNRRDEAIASFEKALQIFSGHAVAHYNLGITLRSAGKHEQAEAHLTQSCRLGFASACEYMSSRQAK